MRGVRKASDTTSNVTLKYGKKSEDCWVRHSFRVKDTHDADVNIHKSMIRSQASKAVCWVLNHSSNMGKVTSVNNAAKKKVQRLCRSGGHGKSLKI